MLSLRDPRQVLSSVMKNADKFDDDNTNSSISNEPHTTLSTKPSIKVHIVNHFFNEIKIAQTKSEQKDKDIDDMLTVLYSSNEAYFCSSSTDRSKEDDKKISRTAFRIKRK